MNHIKEKWNSSKLTFLLQLLSLLLSIVGLFFLLTLLSDKKNILSLVCLLLSVSFLLFYLFSEFKFSKFFLFLSPIFAMLSFCFLLWVSVYDITDFLQGIKMFGEPSHVPFDITSLVCFFLTFLLETISLFFLKGAQNEK